MREESLPNRRRHRRMGITPACAGRIHRSVCFIDLTADHPRACGKNQNNQPIFGLPPGSPPRMREESAQNFTRKRRYRITPAHAGRISQFSSLFFQLQDHPRACGKNLLRQCFQSLYVGSPPRMREEFVPQAKGNDVAGITPAHAGRIR